MSTQILFNRFPGGRRHAVTLSYDDGRAADRKLVALLNQYGLKGTFCLNSGTVGQPDYVTPEEVSALYAGHEVAAHSVHHHDMTALNPAGMMTETLEDRRTLEALTGTVVDGFSYPYGRHDETLRRTLSGCGIRYARTVEATHSFDAPADRMRWHPTCRHRDDLAGHSAAFLEQARREEASLIFFLWGHSYEFDRDDSWSVIETFCREVGGREDIWYCTNGELADYLAGREALRVSVDGSTVFNPSAHTQWFTADGKTTALEGGGRFQKI